MEPVPPTRWCWCPEVNDAGESCRVIAVVVDDWWAESTSGPVHMFKVECLVHRRVDAYDWQVWLMD